MRGITANKVQGVLRDFLNDNPDIAGKLQSGEPLSPTDLDVISTALSDAVENGDLKNGYQFIDGFLVRVEYQ
jgi:hypothetical protein